MKVRTSSKYDAKRITFEYSTDCFVFVCTTDLGAELFQLYLHHFKTDSDVLGCVRRSRILLSNRLGVCMENLIGPA